MIHRVRKAIGEGEIKLSSKLTPEEARKHQEFSRQVSRKLKEWQKYFRGLIHLLFVDNERGFNDFRETIAAGEAELLEMTHYVRGEEIAIIEAEIRFREYMIGIARSAKKLARGTILLQRTDGVPDLSSEMNLAQLMDEAKPLTRAKKFTRAEIVEKLVYNRKRPHQKS